jgi:hypothetical protein
MRILVEQRLGGEDLPVLAVAARGHLLVDPGLLDRMERAVLGQPFERGDFDVLRLLRPCARTSAPPRP